MTQQEHVWRKSKGSYYLSQNGDVLTTLPSGFYEMKTNLFGNYVDEIDLKGDSLINFSNGPAHQVISQINKFWNKKETYIKMGMPYRRGLLMYGPPGTGKSGTIRLISKELIKNNGLVFNITDFDILEEFIPVLSKIEATRNIVFVFEDLDTLLSSQDEYTLLQLLDGSKAINEGIVFLATTNSPEDISTRLIRPSRFDCLIELASSSRQLREEYIKRICSDAKIDYKKEYLDASDDFTLAETKELITAAIIYDEEVYTAKERVLKYKSFRSED